MNQTLTILALSLTALLQLNLIWRMHKRISALSNFVTALDRDHTRRLDVQGEINVHLIAEIELLKAVSTSSKVLKLIPLKKETDA